MMSAERINEWTLPPDEYMSPATRAYISRLHDQLRDARHDCLVLAMRLVGESDNTFAAETQHVMARWRQRAEDELGIGRSSDPYDVEPSEDDIERVLSAAREIV